MGRRFRRLDDDEDYDLDYDDWCEKCDAAFMRSREYENETPYYPNEQMSNNRGGVTQEVKMAKNNQQAKPTYSDQEKCDYYKNRMNDPNLSQAQRNYAAQRVNKLGGSGCHQGAPTVVTGHDAAFNAGIGYGAAQAGVRVPVSPESKGSFRDGHKQGKALGKNS